LSSGCSFQSVSLIANLTEKASRKKSSRKNAHAHVVKKKSSRKNAQKIIKKNAHVVLSDICKQFASAEKEDMNWQSTRKTGRF